MKLPHLSLLLILTACTGGGDSGGPDAGSADATSADATSADAGPEYADGDWLFEEDRVLDVRITLPESEWDALRTQTRNLFDIVGDDCGEGPVEKVFTYRPATVSIEGTELHNVGIRKKGFLGSLSETKPSLKLKLDKYTDGQTLSGLTRFTLNNAKQDPGYVNQCIGYEYFRDAGIPAPRCNFAHVYVNDRNMGIYVHVESVKKPFLAQHFSDNEGNLYEGTLSDFREGWTATFEKKTNESSAARPEVDALLAALELSGDAFAEALDEVLSTESFFRFWAMESLLAHQDGYAGNSNNFYFYATGEEPGRGITFMPWGIDNLFRDERGKADEPLAAYTRSALPNALIRHPPSREAYAAAMTDLLDTVWDDGEALARIATMEALLEPHLLEGEEERFREALTELRAAVDGREAIFRNGIAALTEPTEELMEPLCFERIGSVETTFATTFAGNGSATLDAVLGGEPLATTSPFSVTSIDEDDSSRALIIAFASLPDGDSLLAAMPVPLAELAPSSREIEDGILLFFEEGSSEFSRAEILSGTLTLSEAGSSDGDAIVGSASLTVWDSPFF